MKKTFGCVVPFIPQVIRSGLSASICTNSTVGNKAVDMWRNSAIMRPNLYSKGGLKPPCMSVHYDMKQTMVDDKNDYTSLLLFFTSRMHVSEQVWSYTFMAYIAENGGFVGLFLGLAVLHLEDVFAGIINRLKD